jgi:SSS family transporter
MGIPYEIGMLAGAAVVLLYTVMGGYLAVVYTDVIQAIIMVVALVVTPILAIAHVGGLGPFVETLRAQEPLLFDWKGTWTMPFFLGFVLGPMIAQLWAFPASVQGSVRFLGLKSLREIPKGALVGIIWYMVVRNTCVLVGLAARAMYKTVEAAGVKAAEQLFTPTVLSLYHPIVAGFILSAVFAAIMSTADSQLLVTASAISRDIYQRILRPDSSERHLVIVSRIVIVLTCLLGLAMATVFKETVLYTVWFAWFGMAAVLGPPLLYGLFWKRFTLSGAWAAAIGGFVSCFVWNYTKALNSICHFAIPASAISFFLGYVVSKMTKPPREEVVRRAFENI